MQTNQPQNVHHDSTVTQAREEYEHLFKQPLPQRAKGMPQGYVGLFFKMPVIFLMTAILLVLTIKYHTDAGIQVIIIILVYWILYIYPDRFFSLTKRTTRNAFRKYPMVKATARRLNEPGSKFLPHATILKIEGQDLFLLHYGFVRWWVMTEPGDSSGEINGMALVNARGQLIENTELLEKTGPVHILSLLGGEDSQLHDGRNRAWSLHTLRYTLPRVEKQLRKCAKEFESKGMGQVLEQLLRNLPFLYDALRNGISIHTGHDKWRKARGWSFGLECLYEDALDYQKMCRAYSHFMKVAYGNLLVEIINWIGQLMYAVSAADQWRGRKQAQWALSMLLALAKAIQTWIYTYSVVGNIESYHLEWYRRKLAKAREERLQIVQR